MFSRRLEIIQNIQPAYPHQHSSSGRPKHAESQACYDTPFTPAQVAANREERIQRDEARTAQLATQPSAAAASIARVTSTTAGLTASADESHLYIKYYTAAHHTSTGSGGGHIPANGRGATADSLARNPGQARYVADSDCLVSAGHPDEQSSDHHRIWRCRPGGYDNQWGRHFLDVTVNNGMTIL